MIIGVAGPYSAPTAEQRQKNLDAMNEAAARLLEMGHVPIIGVNAALPVVEKANIEDRYKAIMDISLAVIDKCEALLVIGESKGVEMEKQLILTKGLPVFHSIDLIPWENKDSVLSNEMADYIFKYFLELMTTIERKAMLTHSYSYKATSDNMRKVLLERGWISDDKEVHQMLADGYPVFVHRVAGRLLRENKNKIFMNNCPNCGKLARTPLAKQCRHCGHDWH
jgi:hypothetical protein